MLFWIIIALIVAATAYFIWNEGDWVYGFHPAFFGSVLGAIALFLCAVFIPGNVDLVSEKTYSLKALGAVPGVEGRFFLGSGTIDGKRILNYIQQSDDKALEIKQAKASDSFIFEDSEAATIVVRHYDFNNGWVLPWTIWSTDKYEFHIPAGSVTESYTIDSK